MPLVIATSIEVISTRTVRAVVTDAISIESPDGHRFVPKTIAATYRNHNYGTWVLNEIVVRGDDVTAECRWERVPASAGHHSCPDWVQQFAQYFRDHIMPDEPAPPGTED